MSKAICSSAPSVIAVARSARASGSAGSPGPCADWSLIVCSCPWGGDATRLVDLLRGSPSPPSLVGVRPSFSSSSSNSSSIAMSPASVPVQRMSSSPSASACSKAMAASLKSSSRARKRATMTSVLSASATRLRNETWPRWRSRSTMIAACSRTLTWGACRCSRPTVGAIFGVIARAAIIANCSGVTAMTSSGSRLGELRLEAGLARGDAPGRGHPLAEGVGDLLVGAVLQQPGEEQVAGLDEGEVLVVLRARRREQARGLEVEQGGGDEEELGGLAEVPVAVGGLGRLDVGDELVGHLGQGDLGDVELVLADEAEQQVEGPREDVEVHLERGGRPARDDAAGGQLLRRGRRGAAGASRADLGRDLSDLARAASSASTAGRSTVSCSVIESLRIRPRRRAR